MLVLFFPLIEWLEIDLAHREANEGCFVFSETVLFNNITLYALNSCQYVNFLKVQQLSQYENRVLTVISEIWYMCLKRLFSFQAQY